MCPAIPFCQSWLKPTGFHRFMKTQSHGSQMKLANVGSLDWLNSTIQALCVNNVKSWLRVITPDGMTNLSGICFGVCFVWYCLVIRDNHGGFNWKIIFFTLVLDRLLILYTIENIVSKYHFYWSLCRPYIRQQSNSNLNKIDKYMWLWYPILDTPGIKIILVTCIKLSMY